MCARPLVHIVCAQVSVEGSGDSVNLSTSALSTSSSKKWVRFDPAGGVTRETVIGESEPPPSYAHLGPPPQLGPAQLSVTPRCWRLVDRVPYTHPIQRIIQHPPQQRFNGTIGSTG